MKRDRERAFREIAYEMGMEKYDFMLCVRDGLSAHAPEKKTNDYAPRNGVQG